MGCDNSKMCSYLFNQWLYPMGVIIMGATDMKMI